MHGHEEIRRFSPFRETGFAKKQNRSQLMQNQSEFNYSSSSNAGENQNQFGASGMNQQRCVGNGPAARATHGARAGVTQMKHVDYFKRVQRAENGRMRLCVSRYDVA